MKSIKKLLYIGTIVLTMVYTACQKTSFYDGSAPIRDTALAPEPVDTIEIPEAYKPYLAKVKEYEAWDKEHTIQVGEVVLLGNSLFTNWPDVQDYFDENVIYNRSIENIVADAVQFYSDRIALPYNPSQIFLYIGETELQSGKSVTSTFNLLKVLIEGIKYSLPHAEITYVSLLKTPDNTSYHSVYDQLNQMLSNYLDGKEKLVYMDLNAAVASTGGTIDPQYFSGNKLNATGTQKLADLVAEKLDGDKPKVSMYFELDGSTYISIPHADEFDIANGASKTYTLWLKPIAGAGGRVLNKRTGTTFGYELVLNATLTMAANLRSISNANVGTPNSAGNLLADQWNHLALMYDQTGTNKMCRIYLNGALLVESSAAMIQTTNQAIESTSELLFGTLNAKTAFLKAGIDNIRLYNKALSIQEIEEDMNTLELTDYTNIIAEYDFEDISGNEVKNKVTDQHHGTIVGAVKTNQRIVE